MISFNVLKYFDYPQFGKRCCKQCVKILKFQEERYNLNKISILSFHANQYPCQSYHSKTTVASYTPQTDPIDLRRLMVGLLHHL